MGLSWITVVWSAMAAGCITIGTLYASAWFRERTDTSHVAFAALAVGVGCIAIAELLLMRADSPATYAIVLRWAHVPIFACYVALTVFVRLYLGTGSLWLGGGACLLRLISLIINFSSEQNVNYLNIVALEQIPVPGGETIAIPVGTPNPANRIVQLSIILLLLFLMSATIRAWRSSSPQERAQKSLVGASLVAFVLIAAGHYELLYLSVVRSPFLISAPFLFVTLAMTWQLSADMARSTQNANRLRQSEAALQRNRQRIESAAAAAQTAIWEWDIGRDSIWITEQGRELFGIAPGEDVTIERLQALVHPDDRSRIYDEVAKSLREAATFEREYRIVPPGGTLRWISTRGTVELDAAGRPSIMRGLSIDITERKRAQESIGLLAAIVESSTEAIIGEDLHGVVSSWNAGAQTIFGFTADEMIGQPVSQLIPPGLQSEERELFNRVLDGERVEHYETTRARKDGTLVAVSVSLSPIRGANERIIAASQIIHDISERQRADAALRESESRFRAMADSAPIMIWMAGPDQLFTFFNKAWLNFSGGRMARNVGDGWSAGVHPEDLASCARILDDAYAGRRTFEMEYRLRRGDGEYRWVLDTGAPRVSPDGTFLGYIGSCLDITERKLAAEMLRKERGFLRQVIDVDPNLVFAKDAEGRFTLVNQAVADAFGTTVENIIGKTDADFNPNPAEVAHFRRRDEQVMQSQQELLIPEETLTTANGKVLWLQTVKRPLLDERGVATQILGSATDITERKRAEFELAAQRNELAHLARVAMLGELSGSLAHELNQPLTAILANARAAQRFLAQENPDLKEVHEILQDIVNDDKRAGEVISGLRLLLKKGEMERQPIEINAIVSEVLRLMRSDLLNSSVIANIELAPGLPNAYADRVQVQQVLINLIANACEAMSEVVASSRQLIVRTALTVEREICVSVSDMGTGISDRHLSRLFDPFFTTKPQGLGLGLSVCRTILDGQGGRLWAANNTTRGATFYFTLPVAAHGNDA